jgi:hypothetical protein
MSGAKFPLYVGARAGSLGEVLSGSKPLIGQGLLVTARQGGRGEPTVRVSRRPGAAFGLRPSVEERVTSRPDHVADLALGVDLIAKRAGCGGVGKAAGADAPPDVAIQRELADHRIAPAQKIGQPVL